MTVFKKIAAFGAGSGLKDLLALKPVDVELVCVADNGFASLPKSVFDVRVISPDGLRDLDLDAVIITAGVVDEIKGQLNTLGIDPEKIIALCPSASRNLVALVNQDIRKLSVGFGKILPEAGIASMYLRADVENPQASAWPIDFVRTQSFTLFAEQIKSQNVGGSVAELGVFRGDQAHLISQLFQDETFHLFDTFQGFSEVDLGSENVRSYSTSAAGEFSNTSVDLVLSKIHNPSRVVVHQGFFPETTDGVEDRFSFVSLDVDLHDPTLAGLRWFYPRMNKGGVIFVHDFNNCRYNGVRDAVNTFIAETGAKIMPIPDFSGSVAVLK